MMFRLEHTSFIEDSRAALAYLGSRPDVEAGRVGVTGFCMGGGLTFVTACELSNEIAAAAPWSQLASTFERLKAARYTSEG